MARPKKKQTPDKKRKEKRLYKIGHIVKLLNITPRTIRYYDQFGLLPDVKRSEGGVRLFDERDVQIIEKVRRMQREEFLPLDEIKRKIFGRSGEQARNKVVLVDSTAAIPEEIRTRLNIQVVPLRIEVAGKTYADDGSISTQDLWERSKGLSLPVQTLPPTEGDFIEAFEGLYKKGHNEIFAVLISPKLSMTMQNAQSAAHKVSDHIHVHCIDSGSTGAGLGLLAQVIAEAIDEDHATEQITYLVKKNAPLVYDILTVNSLQFLLSEEINANMPVNRLNLMKKFLSFKPVLRLLGGELEILECCKEKNQALNLMLDHLQTEIRARGNYVKQITIIYNFLYGEAVELINHVKTLYRNTPIHMVQSSPIISAYVGPESIGIS
ncbi:MAG: DegV family protein, partial [Candidatus Margulisiibacteriota bacterium]